MAESSNHAKRVASESAEGDEIEKKKTVSETFPETIFEEEARRLLGEQVKEWRRKKSVQDIVDKIKEILKDKATAEKIDRVRFSRSGLVYRTSVRLSDLFDETSLCGSEPTRALSWDVKRAVSDRLIRAIDPNDNDRSCLSTSVDDADVCKRYLREQWFASNKRPKDRPNLKAAQEEARKKGLPGLAILLGKLPALWKQFEANHYGKKEKKQEQSDSDDE